MVDGAELETEFVYAAVVVAVLFLFELADSAQPGFEPNVDFVLPRERFVLLDREDVSAEYEFD